MFFSEEDDSDKSRELKKLPDENKYHSIADAMAVFHSTVKENSEQIHLKEN